jgi:hypothetical protein
VVQFHAGARNVSLLLGVQTGSGIHPVSYSMVSGVFPEGKQLDYTADCSSDL